MQKWKAMENNTSHIWWSPRPSCRKNHKKVIKLWLMQAINKLYGLDHWKKTNGQPCSMCETTSISNGRRSTFNLEAGVHYLTIRVYIQIN